ncbi:expressed protein [Echinococcus multilocularis]|uniref:Expressed protein n=1 Tax=Echinococcus multilocularis TaxID=6211 RepID=A0A068Y2V8_ECHMU|nr:expressed protein [Echinococcus multilocularis]
MAMMTMRYLVLCFASPFALFVHFHDTFFPPLISTCVKRCQSIYLSYAFKPSHSELTPLTEHTHRHTNLVPAIATLLK